MLAGDVAMGLESAPGTGHQLHPDPVRTTELAPALPPPSPHTALASGYAPPQVGLSWNVGRFSGQDFGLQPDGTRRLSWLSRNWSRMNTVEKPMGACAWCMEPALAVVAPARCESFASGMAALPRSRRPRECAVTSAPSWACSPALEGLESEAS